MSKQVSLVSSCKLAAIESCLLTASLPELRIAIEQLSLFSQHMDGMRQVIFKKRLFEVAFERIEILNNEEIALNHFICDLHCQLGDLEIAISRLSAEEIADELDFLHQCLISLTAPSTRHLQMQVEQLKKKWTYLHFLYTFPDALELSTDAFQDNFYFQTQREMEALPLHERKKKENFLKLLQQHCALAEAMFCRGDLTGLGQFPSQIKKNLVEKLGVTHFNELIPQENREQLAAVVMTYVADRITAL